MRRIPFSILVFLLLFSCQRTGRYVQTEIHHIEIPQFEPEEEPEPPEPPVMVVFDGEILNIFFHPLIAWPEIAFFGDMRRHFLDWFVTADEFQKIIQELYELDYVLIDINEFYEVVHVNGQKRVIVKELLVPEGKKPMILSIDDLSYYEHVRDNGSIHKLVIDEHGGIAAWTAGPDGGELSYDLDIVTILEDFIKKHPDFSVRGAKGIIALTGYEGILGYQTQRDAPDFQNETVKAIAVVERLKELGWRFASHSWGHLNMPNVPMNWFTYDLFLWDRDVKHIMGDSDLYIYPFGATINANDEKHKILRDRGYNVFFGVGSGWGHYEGNGYMHMNRRNIDGVYFNQFRERPNRLFDIDKVADKVNRGWR